MMITSLKSIGVHRRFGGGFERVLVMALFGITALASVPCTVAKADPSAPDASPIDKSVDQPTPRENPSPTPDSSGDQPPDNIPNMDRYKSTIITIVNASYGDSNGDLKCQATELVKRQCDGKHHCAIDVNPILCGHDQAPSVLIPYLIVQYRCSKTDKVRFQKTPRPFLLRVSCEHTIPSPS